MSHAFRDARIETISSPDLAALQLQRLQDVVSRVHARVPLYQQRLAERDVTPASIRSLDDVRRLPFTTADDLRQAYPAGLLAVPMDQALRLHTSSGTTGRPKALFFSPRDVENAAELCARSFVACGLGRHDVFQNMMTYGMFTGALVTHYGAERVGCLVIPAGPGNTDKQFNLMRDFGTTAIHTTPSFALHFADFLERKGVDPRRELKLRHAFVGAEPYTLETRDRIEAALGVRVYNSYGLTEMNGPGVAFDCGLRTGMHLWEDQFLLEIINPETGEPVPDGQTGELVLTTLCREAMPLLRYRTRDITSIVSGICPCGRTHRRLARMTGRVDDMLIVRGVNVYPQQIENVLMATPEVGRNYVIVLEGRDDMTVRAELSTTTITDERRETLQLELAARLRSEILTKPRVQLVAPGTLPVAEGKAKRVIDNRTM
jgi:phenylacetate-CoA ligase